LVNNGDKATRQATRRERGSRVAGAQRGAVIDRPPRRWKETPY